MPTVRRFVRKKDGEKVVGWGVTGCPVCERIWKENKILRALGKKPRYFYCKYHRLVLDVLRFGEVKETRTDVGVIQIDFEITVGENSKIITVTIDTKSKMATISNDKMSLKLQPDDLIVILRNKKLDDRKLLDIVDEQLNKVEEMETEIKNA